MKIRLPNSTMDWVMNNKGNLSMEQFVVQHLNRLADSKKEKDNETTKHVHTVHTRI